MLQENQQDNLAAFCLDNFLSSFAIRQEDALLHVDLVCRLSG